MIVESVSDKENNDKTDKVKSSPSGGGFPEMPNKSLNRRIAVVSVVGAWEQELDEFGVEGIPHFAFLDGNGNEKGNVVGKLPKKYFLENVDAFATGKQSIPHARVIGHFSNAEARVVHQVAEPRSHG